MVLCGNFKSRCALSPCFAPPPPPLTLPPPPGRRHASTDIALARSLFC